MESGTPSAWTSDRAVVHPSARLGAGTKIWPFANILANVVIGENCNIGVGAEIGRDSILGSGVRISYGVFLSEETVVGDNVFIGPRAVTTADKWPIASTEYTPRPAIIEDWASIGAGAVLCPGVRIGHGALVAAGAVVTKNVPPYQLAVGCPARIVANGEWASRVMLRESEARLSEAGFPDESHS